MPRCTFPHCFVCLFWENDLGPSANYRCDDYSRGWFGGPQWAFKSLKIKLSDLLPHHIRMNFLDPLKTLLTVMLKYCVSVKVIVNSALNVCNAPDSGKSSKLDTRRGNNYNLNRRLINFGNKKSIHIVLVICLYYPLSKWIFVILIHTNTWLGRENLNWG